MIVRAAPRPCFAAFRRRAALATALALLAATGCGPKAHVVFPVTAAERTALDREIARIKADPIAFLRESLAAAGRLEQCTMTFQRQERLGLMKELHPAETMFVEYRDKPFSIRFTWTDADSEYRQCVFVDGRNDGKVLILPRKGLFGVKPTVQSYPPSYAVAFGKTRNPVTDFGPRRMMERTLDRIAKSGPLGGVKFSVRDEVEIGSTRERCHHLEILYPPGDEFACKLQDLYVSIRTKIPCGTYLWLTDTDVRSDDTLDGMYLYSGLQDSTDLTDEHFKIDPPPEPKKDPSKKRPQSKSKSD